MNLKYFVINFLTILYLKVLFKLKKNKTHVDPHLYR